MAETTKPRVVVAGETVLDAIQRLRPDMTPTEDPDRRFLFVPDAPVRFVPAGAAAVVANLVADRAQHFDCSFVSPDSFPSRRLRGVHRIRLREGWTRRVDRFYDHCGRAVMTVAQPGLPVSAEDARQLLMKLVTKLYVDFPDLLAFVDYGDPRLPPTTTRHGLLSHWGTHRWGARLFEFLHDQKMPILVQPNRYGWDFLDRVLGDVDPERVVVVLNDSKRVPLLGFESASIIRTRGSQGVEVESWRGRRAGLIIPPARAFAVYDPVGAGDAFLGVLARGLARGLPDNLEDAARVIQAAVSQASDAVTHPGPYSGNNFNLDFATLSVREICDQPPAGRIVLTNGVFDLFHSGHAYYFDQLRAQLEPDDTLVVGVNSEESVRAYKRRTPIEPFEVRAFRVASQEGVGRVVKIDTADCLDLVCGLKPAVYVKGGDYRVKSCPEIDAARAVGAEIRFIDRLEPYSTSSSLELRNF